MPAAWAAGITAAAGLITGAAGTKTSSTGSGTSDTNTSQDSSNLTASILKGSTTNASGTTSLAIGSKAADAITSNTQQQLQDNTTSSTSGSSTNERSTSVSASSKEAIGAIASDYALARQNASDYGKTGDLVSNILQQAALNFAPTFALQSSAGIYNGTTTQLLSGNAQGAATAASAKAVLDYQTNQQALAGQAASNLADASKSVVNEGSSETTSFQNVVNKIISSLTAAGKQSSTASNQDVGVGTVNSQGTTNQGLINAGQSSMVGEALQNTTQQSSGSSGSGLSVICTELRKQEKLATYEYRSQMVRFQRMPLLFKEAYWTWGRPTAQFIAAYPEGRLAKAMTVLMRDRAVRYKWAVVTTFVITLVAGVFVLLPKKALAATGIRLTLRLEYK